MPIARLGGRKGPGYFRPSPTMLDVRVRGNVIRVGVINENIGERGQVNKNGRDEQESRKQPEIRRCFRIYDGSVWGPPLGGTLLAVFRRPHSQIRIARSKRRARA